MRSTLEPRLLRKRPRSNFIFLGAKTRASEYIDAQISRLHWILGWAAADGVLPSHVYSDLRRKADKAPSFAGAASVLSRTLDSSYQEKQLGSARVPHRPSLELLDECTSFESQVSTTAMSGGALY